MDPFTHPHFIGRVESTQKKLCFVIRYTPNCLFNKDSPFGYKSR